MLSDWYLRFQNILLNSVMRIFKQYLVHSLKHCLATNRRRKLSHIWQPVMPKVRVENVEDEECYNFIPLKCPTINKEFYISCCLTIWLFFPVWLFSEKVSVSGNPEAANITPKGKNCSTASEVNDRFATNQNLISVELQSFYECNSTYVRCFEVIYTRQQNAMLQLG